MAISTEFLLRSRSLPLTSTARSLQSHKIECVHGLYLEKGVWMFTANIDTTDNISESELIVQNEIRDATLLGATAGKQVYKLAVEIPEPISEIINEQFDGGPLEPLSVSPRGWHEHKIFKNYNVFKSFRDRCEENDISFDLISITQSDSVLNDDSQYGLTDRQHEVLTLALSRGYYEAPRRTSTAELAEELEISSAAVSNLLRRGESQLLTHTLGSRPDLNEFADQP